MKRAFTFIVALAAAVFLGLAPAQSQQANRRAAQNNGASTYPVYPGMGYGWGGWGYPGWGWGSGLGWGAWGAGTTPPGSIMLGAGYMALGAGEFLVDSSIAAINYGRAYDEYLSNAKKAQATWYELKRMNASYRAEQEFQRPHPTPEQIVQFNKSRLPKRLTYEEWQPANHFFLWPPVLAGERFANDRAAVEYLFADRANDPLHAGYGTASYRKLHNTVQQMSDHLNSMIDELSPEEFLQGHKFLQSLAYEARLVPSNVLAKAGASVRK